MGILDLDDLAGAVPPLMDGFPAPWCVAGGWALDLFLGRVTRRHADLELAVFRRDQALLHRQLPRWRFVKVTEGRREPWTAGERLSLPVHEIHARSSADPPYSVEFLLNERDASRWVFRRNPAVTLPLDRAVLRCEVRLPVLCPAIVLLYKAKAPRARDEADFLSAVEAMGPARRQWLRESLHACHPGHPWMKSLRGG